VNCINYEQFEKDQFGLEKQELQTISRILMIINDSKLRIKVEERI
jgi:hypothetical protein